jgi:hypothetical protein
VGVGELINIETLKREERIKEKTTTSWAFDVFMLNHTSGLHRTGCRNHPRPPLGLESDPSVGLPQPLC